MQAIELFCLEPAPGDDERRRIVHPDGRAGPVTWARLIEQQYRCGAGYLLIMTADSPFEEQLYVVLLRFSDLSVLDMLDIRSWYTPSVLQRVDARKDHVDFDFYAYRWRLTVHKAAKRWPHYRSARATYRPLRRWLAPRYLQLERRLLSPEEGGVQAPRDFLGKDS